MSEFFKCYGVSLSCSSSRNIHEYYIISRKTFKVIYISVRENKDVMCIVYLEETWEFLQFLGEMEPLKPLKPSDGAYEAMQPSEELQIFS